LEGSVPKPIALILAYLAAAVGVVAVQAMPAIGFVLAWLGGPLWAGLILHLMIVHVGLLALSNRIGRAWIGLPLAVYCLGVALWAWSLQAIRPLEAKLAEEIRAARALGFDTGVVSVRGSTPVAESLAAFFDNSQPGRIVHSELHRFEIARGPTCAAGRGPVQPDRMFVFHEPLASRGECLVGTRGVPPDDGTRVVVPRREGYGGHTAEATLPVEIEERWNGVVVKRAVLHAGTAPVIAPLLFPIAGCVYSSNDLRRTCLADLWRYDHVVGAGWQGGPLPGAEQAEAVAAALGLRRRL
jgi:hypothetical protein